MAYLVFFFAVTAAVIVWLVFTVPPRLAARMLMNSGPILLMGAGGLLTLLNKGVLGVPLMLLGVSWWKRSRMSARPISSKGRKSTVRSLYLEMELDHDTGEMDGKVLSGSMEGMRLSSLSMGELLSLYADIGDDADSRALLESFLDRYHSDWRESEGNTSGSSSNGRSGFDGMTREEAYQILGVEPGASKEEIHQAWRHLMKAVHPDSGGSPYLAAKINAARDLLLG